MLRCLFRAGRPATAAAAEVAFRGPPTHRVGDHPVRWDGAQERTPAEFSHPHGQAGATCGCAPPTPSSCTSMLASPFSRVRFTQACRALAYLTTLASASATKK